ncbi:5-bromo-4-chloroindolyl phosphate hydrolysis family protein [Enterococcus cecorum]|uniref:5-bromo-4-chloroindolyl phosphate hydrolysis family protein n=1 Tax=Enterococcus cecorum TaxID=44008 RepID=UPI00311AB45D
MNYHEIKSREAYDRLEEGIQVIEQLTELIQRDYQDFVADDFEDMDIEINMAKKQIEKDSDHQTLQF